MNRDFKVKIETEEAFFADLIAQAEKIDQGIIPEKTVERVSFPIWRRFTVTALPSASNSYRSFTRSAALALMLLPSICTGTTKMYFRM